MSLEIVALEEKHPVEIVEYQFDLSENSAFASNSDTLDANASWYIYDTDDLTTNLSSTMVHAYDYDANKDIIKVSVKSGTNGKSYYLVGVAAITASGRKYLVIGKFKVKSFGVAAT